MSQFLQSLHAIANDPHLQFLAADDPTDKPIVPDYKPKLPGEIRTPTSTILAWTAGGGLSLAVLGGLVGWGLVAIGHNTERASLAARGKSSILWSLISGVGIGVTSGLVMGFYNMSN
ncbi:MULTISPECIES: hypothetical protein [Streptomyces]|uniref:Integral membrane protein n=1 Tax=Streptomyces lonegramiae TaxID=3075524 RepID=A0ABU2XDI2_9ACTN|nr:hypothetical protein [Streptomyces sp. DSM 41529]MDT0543968.1 hypothetical protein [Streptomyces sp. DSM 41529]